MDITTVFETVIPGSSPGGGTKIEEKCVTFFALIFVAPTGLEGRSLAPSLARLRAAQGR